MSIRDYTEHREHVIWIRQMRSSLYRATVFKLDEITVWFVVPGDSGKHGQAILLAKQLINERLDKEEK